MQKAPNVELGELLCPVQCMFQQFLAVPGALALTDVDAEGDVVIPGLGMLQPS